MTPTGTYRLQLTPEFGFDAARAVVPYLARHPRATLAAGAAIMALRKRDAPTLAILDWMMPGMDGLEICRRIREVDRALYIILLTARGSKANRHGPARSVPIPKWPATRAQAASTTQPISVVPRANSQGPAAA